MERPTEPARRSLDDAGVKFRQTVPSLHLALAVALLLAGCGALNQPSGHVELIPSQWDIVSVTGSTIEAATMPTIAIGRSNSARLALHCGEIDLRYTADTGGSALSFGEQRVAATCATPTDPEDLAIRSAVGRVEGWHIVSDTAINLVDGGGKALLSLQATTCDCPHQQAGNAGPTPS